MQEKEWRTDPLRFFYHQLADGFLALGTPEETQTPLDPDAIENMQANFEKEGPSFVPGKCDVVTTYIPVKDRRLVEFLSKTVEAVTSLLPKELDHYVVPPAAYHMSLVMIQDIRPVNMDDKKMNESALSKGEVRKVTRLFDKTMRKLEFQKYDLKLYGICFSARDGAMVAAFEDECQTCRLRAEIADGLQGARKGQKLNYPKNLLLVTLLRPLVQFPPDVLRRLQGVQKELFPLKEFDLTLPVRKVALGKESRWMHAKVKELSLARLR